MSEKTFAKGLYLKTPHERAPDYVKSKVSVNVDEFIEFLQEHKNDSGYVNFDLKEAQSGHWYMEVDDWQPNNSGNNQQPTSNNGGFKPFSKPSFEKKEDSLFESENGFPPIDPNSDIPF